MLVLSKKKLGEDGTYDKYCSRYLVTVISMQSNLDHEIVKRFANTREKNMYVVHRIYSTYQTKSLGYRC